ncbi:MAG: glycosyltransferase [Acidimicrobiales bacterium]
MDRDPVAADVPIVVAVVVTHDPGDWLADVLGALKAQTYPTLRVWVVDAGSRGALTDDITAVLPEAVVHRLDTNPGFGAAANEVLDQPGLTADAKFLLFCHDDVAPDPGAVQAMVETALATGAGIVGPKLVAWDDPGRLLQLGDVVDRAGIAMPLVDPGELDQGQHDGERDVFAAAGGFVLVRADLFAHVGGFDEEISFLADDLSLCWRAHLVGARVVAAGGARVRHRQALDERVPQRRHARLVARHRLRVVLTSYRRRTLVWLLPQLLAWTAAMAAASLLRLRGADARAVIGAWWWNLRRARSTLVARRHIRRLRQVSDRDVRRLQVPGLVHLQLRLQRTSFGSGVRRRAVRDRLEAWGARWSRGGIAVLLVLAGVLLLGSRHLLTRGVPAVGELAPFGRPGDVVDQWLSTWRSTGLGSDGPSPTALGVLGGIGEAVAGHDGLVRLLATVGLIPVGLIGAARLLRPTASRWAPVGATVAYAVVPVPYAALADGRWGPLATYAAAPFLLGGLARASGTRPFGASTAGAVADVCPSTARPADELADGVEGPVGNGSGGRVRTLARDVVTTGLACGLLAMVVPTAPLVVGVLALGLGLGSLLVLDLRGALRVLLAGLGGALVAIGLHLPWTLHLVRDWPGLPATGAADGWLGIGGGSLSTSWWGWGVLLAAAVPLLVGRAWRVGWAVRAWVVAGVAWASAWIPGGGWLRYRPDQDVLVACAGAAVALAVGLGIAATERDVAGRSRHFGLRRSAVWLGAMGLVAASVPALQASMDGYWHMPRGSFADVLSFVDRPDANAGRARVLWLGDPRALPVPGRLVDRQDDDLAFAVTEGLPTLADRWASLDDPGADRVAHASRLALTRQTARLGQLLAPMAVDYVVVLQRRAPSSMTEREWPAPPELVEALAGQLDLRRVGIDPAALVFRNLAALPERSAHEDLDALAVTPPGQRPGSVGEVAAPVLQEADGYGRWTGWLPAGGTMVQSVGASDRWVLEVDGVAAPRRTAFGWANAFDVGPGGQAVLRYETPASYHLVLAGQALLWLAVVLMAVRLRRPSTEVGPATMRPAVPSVPLSSTASVSASAIEPPAPADRNGGVAPLRRRTLRVRARRPAAAGPGAAGEPVGDAAGASYPTAEVVSVGATPGELPPVVESVKVIGKRRPKGSSVVAGVDRGDLPAGPDGSDAGGDG